MKILVRYYEEFGRMGEVTSLFVTTPEELQEMSDFAAKSKYGIELGECLGKHSEIWAMSDNDHTIEVLSCDQDFIEKLLSVFQREPYHHFISGEDLLNQFREAKECA